MKTCTEGDAHACTQTQLLKVLRAAFWLSGSLAALPAAAAAAAVVSPFGVVFLSMCFVQNRSI
jgi:hypothetical protein